MAGSISLHKGVATMSIALNNINNSTNLSLIRTNCSSTNVKKASNINSNNKKTLLKEKEQIYLALGYHLQKLALKNTQESKNFIRKLFSDKPAPIYEVANNIDTFIYSYSLDSQKILDLRLKLNQEIEEKEKNSCLAYFHLGISIADLVNSKIDDFILTTPELFSRYSEFVRCGNINVSKDIKNLILEWTEENDLKMNLIFKNKVDKFCKKYEESIDKYTKEIIEKKTSTEYKHFYKYLIH